MYALAVIDWLVAQHNQLVQIVAGATYAFGAFSRVWD